MTAPRTVPSPESRVEVATPRFPAGLGVAVLVELVWLLFLAWMAVVAG